MFANREDAGKKLGYALSVYAKELPLVLAIPRGGVETAFYAAKHLGAAMEIIVSRKLPAPWQNEAALGAIAEDGSTYILPYARSAVSEHELKSIIEMQKKEVLRRIGKLRGGRKFPDISGRTVIIVDDGMAMGATMAASILMCRKAGAKKIIAAVPVSAYDTAEEIRQMCDEAVVLEMPRDFYAVGQVYSDFHQLTDEEVLYLMKMAGQLP